MNPSDRFTRLLCANVYFLGLVASLPAIHRIVGPPFRPREHSLGIDRSVALHHALQSALLSGCTLVPLAALYFLAPARSTVALATVFVICLAKVAFVNPWIARRYFNGSGSGRELRLPGVTPAARLLGRILEPAPPEVQTGEPAVYFCGGRPFVGFGSEINAWTLAVDTTAQWSFAGTQPVSAPRMGVTEDELYDAIETKVRSVDTDDVRARRVVFIEGDSTLVDDCGGRAFRRPPSFVTTEACSKLEADGAEGRRYLSLTVVSKPRDLMVSQLIRFTRRGKLLFCEFASHVLPPGRARFYVFERLFRFHPLVYAVMGALVFVAAGVSALAAGPFLEALAWLGPQAREIWTPDRHVEFLAHQVLGGWFVYRIVAVSLMLVLAFAAWRAWLVAFNALGIFLGLRQNRGLRFSCRERWASAKRLGYFDLQDTIRALQIQEKVLINGLAECLEARGIDTTDLKQKISAFINQGVINSGEIRGDVSNKVASIVFRRERARRKRRGLAVKAA